MFLEELSGSYKILVIKRIFDVNKVRDILVNPVIWGAISSEEIDIASFTVEDKRSHIHLIGYLDDTPIGVFIVHPNLRKEYYCHVQVLPNYRKTHAKAFGKAVLDWIWNNTEILVLNASINEKFSNVTSFAQVNGFTKVDYNNDTWHMKVKRKGKIPIKKQKDTLNELRKR